MGQAVKTFYVAFVSHQRKKKSGKDFFRLFLCLVLLMENPLRKRRRSWVEWAGANQSEQTARRPFELLVFLISHFSHSTGTHSFIARRPWGIFLQLLVLVVSSFWHIRPDSFLSFPSLRLLTHCTVHYIFFCQSYL